MAQRFVPPQDYLPGHRVIFRKTKACKFYAMGRCLRGEACNFAHEENELAPLPDFRCTKLCPELLETGQCARGCRCTFAHSEEELREPSLGSSAEPVDADANSFFVPPAPVEPRRAPQPMRTPTWAAPDDISSAFAPAGPGVFRADPPAATRAPMRCPAPVAPAPPPSRQSAPPKEAPVVFVAGNGAQPVVMIAQQLGQRNQPVPAVFVPCGTFGPAQPAPAPAPHRSSTCAAWPEAAPEAAPASAPCAPFCAPEFDVEALKAKLSAESYESWKRQTANTDDLPNYGWSRQTTQDGEDLPGYGWSRQTTEEVNLNDLNITFSRQSTVDTWAGFDSEECPSEETCCAKIYEGEDLWEPTTAAAAACRPPSSVSQAVGEDAGDLVLPIADLSPQTPLLAARFGFSVGVKGTFLNFHAEGSLEADLPRTRSAGDLLSFGL